MDMPGGSCFGAAGPSRLAHPPWDAMSSSEGSPSVEIFQLLFEDGWYLDRHPDALAVGGLEHFLTVGDAAGYWPHPLFDSGYYGSQHPELVEEGGARFAHYLQHGGRDGSNPHPLFRSRFYLEQSPELEASGGLALAHYLAEGEARGLAANPLFDAQYYSSQNPDLARVHSLLGHYAEWGAHEGRAPNPLFAPEFYEDQVRGRFVERRNLLAHYLDHGDREGLLPHPLFDPTYYGDCESAASLEDRVRLADYLRHGSEPGRDPHPLFHAAYYASQLSNPTVGKQSLLVHYLAEGERQNLKPNPLFDPSDYAQKYEVSGLPILEHYARYGRALEAAPSRFFDARWVAGQMPPSAKSTMSPLEYYFRQGGKLAKDPHPLFSGSWYLSEYPEAEHSTLDPLSHFMEIGAKKGFDPHPLFDSNRYRDLYSDFFDEELPPIFHYLEFGQALGLRPNPLFDADFYLSENQVHLQDGETAFGHFCRVGIDKKSRPSRLFSFCLQFFREKSSLRRARGVNPLSGYLSSDYSEFTSPQSEIQVKLPPVYRPDVSIIIPVYGQVAFTLACLRSISRAENKASFEVIVVDDHSPIADYRPLAEISNLRALRNSENLGFLRSCNAGAKHARGEDLVILNNDTLVTDGWIDALIETRVNFPDAGLIGSRLIFPDGSLQEAGSIVWRDGSAFNYGLGEDASVPRFAFARQVDYVSAAAILINAEFFGELDGFDERYAPAFYEDVDLAFRVREAGRSVVYQPASTVIHFGGASHGRDTSVGLKRYQVLNRGTFVSRWESRLKDHYEPDSNPNRAAFRLGGPRVLIIDATMLTPDRDAGSLRMFNLMKVLQTMGFAVTFVPNDLGGTEAYENLLREAGIDVVCFPHVTSVEGYLEGSGMEFELCIVSRPDTADRCLASVMLLCPNALVLYDTVDLHFLRRERELRIKGVTASEESIKRQELWAAGRADGAITVSEFDRRKLLEMVPLAPVHVISLIHELHPQSRSFNERDGILFVGSFQHHPNVDGVLWFLSNVMPIVHAWIPDLRFHIIGTNPPKEICEQACEYIVIEGFIENMDEQLASRRLSVAPLRYGSGVKGKINQSMAYGLPCVATPSAVEGMELDWQNEILVAESAHDFAEAIAELYENEEYWTLVAEKSMESIERSFSPRVAEDGIRKMLEYHGRECLGPDPARATGSK
jgi:GT2 family glycosyltransferase/glycosyltransferase involved in cell wall biosynthesis